MLGIFQRQFWAVNETIWHSNDYKARLRATRICRAIKTPVIYRRFNCTEKDDGNSSWRELEPRNIARGSNCTAFRSAFSKTLYRCKLGSSCQWLGSFPSFIIFAILYLMCMEIATSLVATCLQIKSDMSIMICALLLLDSAKCPRLREPWVYSLKFLSAFLAEGF